MSLQSVRTWVVGGVLVALALSALGWQLLVAPQRATAAATRDQVTAARAAEEAQRARLAQLTADFAELPAHRAELAAARASVPVELDLPGLTRRLAAAASGGGVTLMSVAPTSAVTATTTATAPATGAQAVPLRITVIGPFSAAEQFLTQLQTVDAPSLLVSGLSVTGQEPADASGGKPQTVNGDVELVVDASAFVLPTTAS